MVNYKFKYQNNDLREKNERERAHSLLVQAELETRE